MPGDGLSSPNCEVVAVCPHLQNAAQQPHLDGGVEAGTSLSMKFFFPSSHRFLKVRSSLRLVPSRGGVLRKRMEKRYNPQVGYMIFDDFTV